MMLTFDLQIYLRRSSGKGRTKKGKYSCGVSRFRGTPDEVIYLRKQPISEFFQEILTKPETGSTT